MKAVSRSRWEGADPIGFTAFMAKELNTVIPVDQTASPETVTAYLRRCDLLETVMGMRAAKQNGAIRRAVLASN